MDTEKCRYCVGPYGPITKKFVARNKVTHAFIDVRLVCKDHEFYGENGLKTTYQYHKDVEVVAIEK